MESCCCKLLPLVWRFGWRQPRTRIPSGPDPQGKTQARQQNHAFLFTQEVDLVQQPSGSSYETRQAFPSAQYPVMLRRNANFTNLPVLGRPNSPRPVIFLGSPSFGALPSSTGCNSFFPSLVLAPTANGFSVTGTVQIQLSGPTASICSVTWSASVLVLITQGFVTVDGTIDASLSMPADVPTLAAASTPGS